MCTKIFPARIKLYAIINTKIDLSIKKGGMTMEYYAHTREDGERQTVKDHLVGVSKLAEDFSVDILKPLAKKASLSTRITRSRADKKVNKKSVFTFSVKTLFIINIVI